MNVERTSIQNLFPYSSGEMSKSKGCFRCRKLSSFSTGFHALNCLASMIFCNKSCDYIPQHVPNKVSFYKTCCFYASFGEALWFAFTTRNSDSQKISVRKLNFPANINNTCSQAQFIFCYVLQCVLCKPVTI